MFDARKMAKGRLGTRDQAWDGVPKRGCLENVLARLCGV